MSCDTRVATMAYARERVFFLCLEICFHGLCKKIACVRVWNFQEHGDLVILFLEFSRPCMDLGGQYKTKVSVYQAIHVLPVWHMPMNLFFLWLEICCHGLCKKKCLGVSVEFPGAWSFYFGDSDGPVWT